MVESILAFPISNKLLFYFALTRWLQHCGGISFQREWSTWTQSFSSCARNSTKSASCMCITTAPCSRFGGSELNGLLVDNVSPESIFIHWGNALCTYFVLGGDWHQPHSQQNGFNIGLLDQQSFTKLWITINWVISAKPGLFCKSQIMVYRNRYLQLVE